MNDQRWRFFLAAAAAGASTGIPVLIPSSWILSWFGLWGLFYIAENAPRLRTSMLWGWFHHIVFGAIVYNFLTYVMTHYGGMPMALALLVFLAYLLVFFTKGLVMGALLYWVARGHRAWQPYTYAAAVVASDMLQFALFPGSLGNYQLGNFYLLQCSDLVGITGVGVPVAFLSATVWIWIRDRKPPVTALVLSISLMAAAYVYGVVRYGQIRALEQAANPVKVAIVQPNTPLRFTDPAEITRMFEKLQRHSMAAWMESGQKLDLLVWPEGSTPFSLSTRNLPVDMAFRGLVTGLAQSLKTNIVLNDHHLEPSGEYNNAWLVDRNGQPVDNYKKMFLLAFGEYIPFSEYIPMLRGVGGISSNMRPGSEIKILQSDTGNIAPNICYEILFGNLCRRFVGLGADIIVNMTNDTWFGPLHGSHCHLYGVVPRAVENRVPLIRATNSGISTIISATGEYVSPHTPLFVDTHQIATIHPPRVRTLYTNFGDWLGWLCVILTALGAWPALKGPVKTAPNPTA